MADPCNPTTICNCRQPGLGGDCDGSCTHPPPTNQTTHPTEAELDELLGKPGPPIEVDPEQLAVAVALQRAEAKSQTTLPRLDVKMAHVVAAALREWLPAKWEAVEGDSDWDGNDLMLIEIAIKELERMTYD